MAPLDWEDHSKISSWTSKKLSYEGGTQLVQTAIFGMQAYWAQLFIIPAKVTKIVDAYCRSYICSGGNVITKKALVSWKNYVLQSQQVALILLT